MRLNVRKRAIATAVVLFTGIGGHVHAGWTDDLFRANAMFRCSAYASVAKLKPPYEYTFAKQEERLFGEGIKFALRGVRNFHKQNRLTEHALEQLPDVLTHSLTGPNEQFIAGRVAEKNIAPALQKIRDAAKSYDWVQASYVKAAEFYRKNNCSLLR